MGGRSRAGSSRLPQAPWVRGEGDAALLAARSLLGNPSLGGESRMCPEKVAHVRQSPSAATVRGQSGSPESRELPASRTSRFPLRRVSRALAGGAGAREARRSRPLSPACTRAFPQLTETSSRYARKISGTTALQEALKEKQQHIEQLLAERDLERAEVAKATSHICEVEKEIALLKAQHEQVAGPVGWGVGAPPGQPCRAPSHRES